jgi:hypothetical protein
MRNVDRRRIWKHVPGWRGLKLLEHGARQRWNKNHGRTTAGKEKDNGVQKDKAKA